MNLDDFTDSDGTFSVWQPNSVDIISKAEAADKDPWKLGGWASTAHLDRQGETAFQRGLDFAEFLEHGWFNDNHQQHTSAAIGIPETAELKNKGWYVTGHLLKDVPRAREVYTLAKALRNTHRRLGFSIEGKVVERVGNRISKALIRNVAITNCPVNTACTWDLIQKSWLPGMAQKALDVGFQYPPVSGGDALVAEDLERGEVRVLFQCSHCKKAFHTQSGMDEHVVKAHKTASPRDVPPESVRRELRRLNKSQAMHRLAIARPWWSEAARERLTDYVLNKYGQEETSDD